MQMHVICLNNSYATPKIEPSVLCRRTGVIVFDTTEAERKVILQDYADLCDLDSADQLKWVEVIPRFQPI